MNSPCLGCPNHLSGIDKRLCLDACKRLAAYRAGRDYTKEEVFIVPEGKDLLEDIERKHQVRHGIGHDSIDFEEPDNESEEIETDIEKIPGIVKHIPPETSWKKRLTLQGYGHKSVTSSEKICAICGKPEVPGNRFLRGVCRKPCYNQWYIGKIEHPVLGKFKTAPKEVISMKKETMPAVGRIEEAVRPVDNDNKICPTTININLELYPQIWEAVYRMAVDLSLPVSHVAVTLLGEALAGRRRNP